MKEQSINEFFQNGFIYLPTFNGKVSLKVVTPSLINNEYVKYYKSMPWFNRVNGLS